MTSENRCAGLVSSDKASFYSEKKGDFLYNRMEVVEFWGNGKKGIGKGDCCYPREDLF